MPQDDDRQALSSESQHLPMVRSAKRTRSPTSSDDSEEVDNVMRIVENVTQSPFFLGSPSLLKRVAWYMDTKGVRRLVEVEQESGARPKTAEIRWIAMISPEKFNLHVEGGWNEGFRLGPLEETKARGYLVEPETEPFGSSWKSTVTGAKHVTENARKTFGGILGENQIVLDLSGAICLKVRHTVYKRYDRLDKFQEAQKELNKSIGENTFLSMENWTCKNDTVQDYHDKIVAGNRQSGKNGKFYLGHALPVFSIHGEPVNPAQYQDLLAGAIVEVGAHISHQVCRKEVQDAKSGKRKWREEDNLFADVTYITVLDTPHPDPVSQADERGYNPPEHLAKLVSPQKKRRRQE